jgi:hypothetical protein
LQVRRSVEVVLGCFVLLGAGLLAEPFQQLSAGAAGTDQAGAEQIIIPAPPETAPRCCQSNRNLSPISAAVAWRCKPQAMRFCQSASAAEQRVL